MVRYHYNRQTPNYNFIITVGYRILETKIDNWPILFNSCHSISRTNRSLFVATQFVVHIGIQFVSFSSAADMCISVCMSNYVTSTRSKNKFNKIIVVYNILIFVLIPGLVYLISALASPILGNWKIMNSFDNNQVISQNHIFQYWISRMDAG